jgi:hypothetical protein
MHDGRMIHHVVAFRLRPESRAQAAQLAADLVAGLEPLDTVERVVGGANFRDAPTAYEVGIVVEIADREALERYSADPAHRAAATAIVAASEAIVTFDIEV